MKKKILLATMAIVCVLCMAVGFIACNNTTFDKSTKFISVVDGVFKSAGYKSSTAGAKATAKTATNVPNVAYAASESGENVVLANIQTLYNGIKTNDNAGFLDDYNLNYLKGDALYQGANLAGLFKAMAMVLGDGVFSNVYDLTKLGMEGSVAKLDAGDSYTLYGVTREENVITSAIQIDFNEYSEGKFVFKLAQYSKMNGVSEFRFSYYDSQSVAMIATLQGDISANFASYDEDYDAYAVVECTIAIFGNEDYVSEKSNSTVYDEAILKFVKNNLGYNNQTYITLASIGGGKEIGNKEANEIGSKMYENRYTNPYLGTNGNMNVTVSSEYRIPDDVTEVATASIPATKKLIVPAHVEKILDAPFKYPQYVEEIVFEDPDNGALVQIGDDDIVEYYDNGEFWYRMNRSSFFLISYTKVKNFTLPKTVKKIEGSIYITTEMDVLDLSAYHPDYPLDEYKLESEGYTVSLYTSVYNRTNGFYKELGSVKKLYANGDFTLKFDGSNQVETINPDTMSVRVEEYDGYNKTEDKHYEYSPTQEIYMTILAMLADNPSMGEDFDYGEYRGYTKFGYLIDELILTGINEKFDIDSDLFKRVSLSVDESDFAKVYAILSGSDTDKEVEFALLKDGQAKTSIDFKSTDGQDDVIDARMFINTPNGEMLLSQLGYKQEFYAPTVMNTTAIIDGEKCYFVGWSYTANADKADVLAGDKVFNYYQTMYAVYLPATDSIEFIQNGEGTVKAKIDGVNADIIVIPDTYDQKRVTELEIVSYQCKKIILPDTISSANSAILGSIANNRIDGFKSITQISDIENGLQWLGDSSYASLIEKLKTCSSAVYDNGLYYLKNNASNYFMLIGADEALSGQVFISNQCSIIAAAEFGDGVTDVVLPDSQSKLRYICYLKFNRAPSFSIPNCVVQIEYIAGTVTRNLIFPYSTSHKINVFYEAFKDLNVNEVWISPDALEEESCILIGDLFNSNTKIYLQCTFEEIDSYDFYSVQENMYFYSESRPDFDDYYIGLYNFWHYDEAFNFAIWEK